MLVKVSSIPQSVIDEAVDHVAETGNIVANNTMLPVSATMSPVSATMSPFFGDIVAGVDGT